MEKPVTAFPAHQDVPCAAHCLHLRSVAPNPTEPEQLAGHHLSIFIFHAHNGHHVTHRKWLTPFGKLLFPVFSRAHVYWMLGQAVYQEWQGYTKAQLVLIHPVGWVWVVGRELGALCGTQVGKQLYGTWVRFWVPVPPYIKWDDGVFPGGASGKESACQCRRHAFDPWAGKTLWRRK